MIHNIKIIPILFICLGVAVILACVYLINLAIDTKKSPALLLSTALDTNSAPSNGVAIGEGIIRVEVGGAVNNPGLYPVSPDSRVGDLIKLAGGISQYVSFPYVTKNLNLAKKLSDGEKIYIPWNWELVQTQEISVNTQPIVSSSVVSNLPTTTSPGSVSTLVNLNTASESAIDELPGIGPVYLSKIIAGRPYTDLTDFKNKTGIPASSVDKLKLFITF